MTRQWSARGLCLETEGGCCMEVGCLDVQILHQKLKKWSLTFIKRNAQHHVWQSVGCVLIGWLCIVISKDLSWRSWANCCTSIVKRCHAHHFLTALLTFNLNQVIHNFITVIESIICFDVTVWFGGVPSGKKNLEHAPKACQPWSTIRCFAWVSKIVGDPLHCDPANHLFELLHASRHYTPFTIRAMTSQFKTQFHSWSHPCTVGYASCSLVSVDNNYVDNMFKDFIVYNPMCSSTSGKVANFLPN